MSVQEYIEKHELPKRVEEVINATVKAKPDEPLSYMVGCATPIFGDHGQAFCAERRRKSTQIEFRFDACRARCSDLTRGKQIP